MYQNIENNNTNIHRYLNKMYYRIMYSDADDKCLTTTEYDQFKKIEKDWFSNKIEDCFKRYDCHLKVSHINVVKDQLLTHQAFNHPIFTYMRDQADLVDLKTFLLSDAVLNVEFFDYIALALMGTSGQAKAEISTNLWDEAGRGGEEKFHTNLFIRLLSDLNLAYDREQIINQHSWQGLAGINLFSYLALYPFNKMKYFGLLAATEMLDPPHYHQLLHGIKRILKDHPIDCSYYIEHEVIDVVHADGWLNKVILPELKKHPEKSSDFWLGFYLRLDSANDYYNELLDRLQIKAAA